MHHAFSTAILHMIDQLCPPQKPRLPPQKKIVKSNEQIGLMHISPILIVNKIETFFSSANFLSNTYLTHFQPTQYLKIIHMCLPGITFKLACPYAIAVAN
jgi:hypothetical protein